MAGFVDSTPAVDEEFTGPHGADQLQAIDSRAVDRIDLLTVVEHELGHVVGLDDLDWSRFQSDERLIEPGYPPRRSGSRPSSPLKNSVGGDSSRR